MTSHDHLAAKLENSLNIDNVNQPALLMGALIADVLPNIGGIKGSLRASWRSFGGVQISHMRRNIFSIKMTQVEAHKVLEGGPWHVENHHFNVMPWAPDWTINDVPYYLVTYWVRITGLTPEKMIESNARLIGSEIGEVLELDHTSPEDAFLRGYLRIKIRLDSRRSLPTGFWLPVSKHSSSRVEYIYEGLHTFCWRCGMLGHSMDDCKHKQNDSQPGAASESRWFGPWMACKSDKLPPANVFGKPMRVHRRRPSLHHSTMEDRTNPYTTSKAGKNLSQGATGKGNFTEPPCSSSTPHQHPSHSTLIEDHMSFDTHPCSKTSADCPPFITKGILMERPSKPAHVPNAYPSPNWLNLAVTTATTHVQWTRKNWRPPHTAAAYHSLATTSKPTELVTSTPFPDPFFLNKAKTPTRVEPNFALGHSAHVVTPRQKPTTLDLVPTITPLHPHLPTSISTKITLHKPTTRPQPPLITNLPSSSPTPPSLLDNIIHHPPSPPQTSHHVYQPNTDPPPSFVYQNKNKRLASEVDWKINFSHSKTRVVTTTTSSCTDLSLRGIPCDDDISPLRGRGRGNIRSRGTRVGRFSYRRRCQSEETRNYLPGNSSLTSNTHFVFGSSNLVDVSSEEQVRIEQAESVAALTDDDVQCQDDWGLGPALTVQKLGDLTRSHGPSIVFLIETKQPNYRVSQIQKNLGFQFGETFDPIGGAGGLALWWQQDVHIQFLDRTANLLDTIITVKSDGTVFRASWFYGPPYTDAKEEFWESVKNLATNDDCPWNCLSDFNEILTNEEKEGGLSHTWNHPRYLRGFMDLNGLIDVGFSGPKFMWENRRTGTELIRERLDRAIVNSQWLTSWPNTSVDHAARVGSDHCPLIIKPTPPQPKYKKQFKFEAYWFEEPECQTIIQRNWGYGRCLNPFVNWSIKLGYCRRALINWSKVAFPNNRVLIDALSKELSTIQANGVIDRLREVDICLELNRIWTLEDSFWKQRSRLPTSLVSVLANDSLPCPHSFA
ncbi:hypothetical protein M0R45_008218 [Rubus argutus]|uniref:CCHC-type domain-containing protein n=1 Tax=Rubus argutus TaxID=59490 RepID=A0AAW1Y0R1_RUBAR